MLLTQCLACGAVDEHTTRNCPLGTSCFRCGGVGHRSKVRCLTYAGLSDAARWARAQPRV